MGMRFPHDLAICAIMRNEGPFLKEWLDFHLLLGVSKFYLYDNGSEDATAAVLLPYIRSGVAECRQYPGECRQMEAYSHCAFHHRYDCEWLAFIDVDEFLHPLGDESVLQLLRRLQQADPKMAGLGVNWRTFGSNGHERTAPAGVIDSYTRRAAAGYEAHGTIKVIANPRRVRHFFNPHMALFYTGYYLVDEKGGPLDSHIADIGRGELRHICLNHYYTKSRADWRRRRSLGKADAKGFVDVDSFDEVDSHLNDVADDSLAVLRRRLLQECRGVIPEPGPYPGNRGELEQLAHALIRERNDSSHPFDLETLLSIWHVYGPAPEEGGCLTEEEMGCLLCSMLHLRLRFAQGFSISNFQMLEKELRHWPMPGASLKRLQADLERLRPTLEQWREKHPNYLELHMARLEERARPGYVPRVALVIPSLAEGAAGRYLLQVAGILAGRGYRLCVYAQSEGSLHDEFAALGARICLYGHLLEGQLAVAGWPYRYDLIWLHTSCCWTLLRQELYVPRFVFWCLHEDEDGLEQTGGWPEAAADLVQRNYIKTFIAGPGAGAGWHAARPDWTAEACLPPVQDKGGENEEFRSCLLNWVDPVVQTSVSHCLPGEKGVL